MARVQTQHLSEELIVRLDEAVGKAIEEVEDGAAKASVSLAFEVVMDGSDPAVAFTHKHTRTEKGSWSPSRQPALPLYGESGR